MSSNTEKPTEIPFLVQQDLLWLKKEAGCKPLINVTTSFVTENKGRWPIQRIELWLRPVAKAEVIEGLAQGAEERH